MTLKNADGMTLVWNEPFSVHFQPPNEPCCNGTTVSQLCPSCKKMLREQLQADLVGDPGPVVTGPPDPTGNSRGRSELTEAERRNILPEPRMVYENPLTRNQPATSNAVHREPTMGRASKSHSAQGTTPLPEAKMTYENPLTRNKS